MKSKPALKTIIIYCLLTFIVLFNLYLYRSEFTVLSDPNDNVFHAALVDEARKIWANIFSGKQSIFSLFDSWNERWAEGFALSTYYAHLPQVLIALLSLVLPISAFQLFVYVRTLLLILLPLPFFFAGKILKLPLVFNLIVAFFSQVIFTDGLYGLDSSSFLWRGWGLSAQLFAVFFLPLAFAYTIDYLENKKNLGRAVLFNFIVGQAHFGVLLLLLLGYPIYWLIVMNYQEALKGFESVFSLMQQASRRGLDYIFGSHACHKLKSGFFTFLAIENIKRTFMILFLIFLSLAYFIIPFFWLSHYRNFSYWDPIWKFDSWGLKQVLIWLANGDLFDFNRFPFLTLFLLAGFLNALVSEKKVIRYLALLFGFYLVLFFGRKTLGGLIDFIPGFSEYHQHRLVIMVQFAGIFLAGWGGYWVFEFVKKVRYHVSREVFITTITIIIIITSTVVYLLEKPVIKYAKENEAMIIGSNKKYRQEIEDFQKIIDRLKKLPKARVYAGRPGNWGRDFKIADTQIYMALSQEGFPTIGFLPQSWSPNSDPEQFFNEEDLNYYRLYQVGYLVYPVDKKPPSFAKLLEKAGNYMLYRVDTDGWFAFGQTNLTVNAKKTELLNIIRHWFGSGLMEKNSYPKINLSRFASGDKNQIKMVGLNHYLIVGNQKEGEAIGLWQGNPFNLVTTDQSVNAKKIKETVLVDGYQTEFLLTEKCQNCLAVLRQSFHPQWQVTLNGKKTKIFPVFPFFIGIPLTDQQGKVIINARYRPSGVKTGLIFAQILIFAGIFLIRKKNLIKL